MASPRTVPNGSVALRVGLLTVNVTIGKAWADEREKSLRDLCEQHKAPIDGTHRCGAGHADCSMEKIKGVELPDGTWRPLDRTEYATIEDATKSDTLAIQDVRPLGELPIAYSTGTYYLRPDKKVPGSKESFALLVAALESEGMGILVKWGSGSRQRLCIAAVEGGIFLLRTIPYVNELREAGDQETVHQSVATDPKMVAMAAKLLKTQKKRGAFDLAAYEDEALRLRQEAVERVLAGTVPAQDDAPKKKEKPAPAPDLMALLQASIEQATA